jgi:hypothetical protein
MQPFVGLCCMCTYIGVHIYLAIFILANVQLRVYNCEFTFVYRAQKTPDVETTGENL